MQETNEKTEKETIEEFTKDFLSRKLEGFYTPDDVKTLSQEANNKEDLQLNDDFFENLPFYQALVDRKNTMMSASYNRDNFFKNQKGKAKRNVIILGVLIIVGVVYFSNKNIK
tara:strand:- start:5307 stop:5645 length:339 start_codon:yes stop_codon:yes gene_type:complete